MALRIGQTIRGCFFSLCSSLIAFQGPSLEPPITIIRPHAHPGGPAHANEGQQADVRADFSLVLIPAHVTNGDGQLITTLNKESFRLFDNGTEQPISNLVHDDAPLSIGLLFDTSGSMQNKMLRSIEAVSTFFKTANTEDEFFLIQFGERPKLGIPFTRNSDEIYNRVLHIRPFGRTSLLDAIHLAVVQMKNARHLRKALVILSDGGDNRSRYTASEVRNALLESDVQVYAMGIFDEKGKKVTAEERNGPRLLAELTERSGGHLYPVSDFGELPAIGARIGLELRDQYVLGYSPANQMRDGKYHKVQLLLRAPLGSSDLRVYHRSGYYAPLR